MIHINPETNVTPKIVVMGAGAIGGYFGGLLARSGADVTLVDSWAEHVETIRRNGLRVSDISGELDVVCKPRTLHVNEVQSLSREHPIDICILSTKSYDTEWATALIKPYLASDGFVVSMQNCINEQTIAEVVGWGRTVGCIVMISAELIEAGHALRTMGRQTPPLVEFQFGEIHGRQTARIEALAKMATSFDGSSTTSNLWGQRWSKLCINAMHNGVSAISGLNGQDREANELIRAFELRLGCEAVRVGRALGYSFDHIGRFEADKLARIGDGDGADLKEAHEWLVGGSIGARRSNRQRPSLAQDIAKGRRTEIDFINGFVAGEAGSIGMDAPANMAVANLVNLLERGEIKADPQHIFDAEEALSRLN